MAIPLAGIQHSQSLRDTVTEALRTAIIVGDLVEGELYSAPALAEPLGVSATPVREAMMDLAREGLVTTAKNKGFRVTVTTHDDLEELTQVRQLLECPVMRGIAGRIPAGDMNGLRVQADEIAAAAEAGDLRTYLGVDRDFHAALLSHASNERLVDLATRLRGQTRLAALRALADSGRLVHSAQEHHTLLDLLEQGRADEAHDLLAHHIGHASQLWSTGEEQAQADREGAGENRPALLDLLPHRRPRPCEGVIP